MFYPIKVLKDTLGQVLQLGFNKGSNIKINGKLLQVTHQLLLFLCGSLPNNKVSSSTVFPFTRVRLASGARLFN